ncbi:MAG TPA: hypothetical protein VHG51_00185 [Longimicrobiaceae bacterium]|nr:hypothetical protein [Longimicrobiaceae bacterium]
MRDPAEQDEWTTLEAELREALQHREAAREQMLETRREVEALLARARELLARTREGAGERP